MALKKICAIMVVLLLTLGTSTAQDDEPFTWEDPYYAPYIFAGAYPLAYMMEQSGVRYFTLAFVLDGPQDCQAAWGGRVSIENHRMLLMDLEELRKQGGDVIISFGGWAGDELAQVCPDVESLTEQYQSVIDTYQVTRLDFDIEGDEIHHPESMLRRSQAIIALQEKAAETDYPLTIGFTLPVAPTGLTHDGLAVLQSAIDSGIEVDFINIMTMNYGSDYPPDEMGTLTIQAAESLFEQLVILYPEHSEKAIWAMIGLTPMIGLNDVMPEVFTLDDTQLVTDFALEHGIRHMSMWAFSRDKACAANAQLINSTCSGIPQDEYAFSEIFNRFNDHD